MTLEEVVLVERKRCEGICANLEQRWRSTAAKTRRDGTWTTGWPFNRTFVAPKWEQAARNIEAAADGISAIRKLIMDGKSG